MPLGRTGASGWATGSVTGDGNWHAAGAQCQRKPGKLACWRVAPHCAGRMAFRARQHAWPVPWPVRRELHSRKSLLPADLQTPGGPELCWHGVAIAFQRIQIEIPQPAGQQTVRVATILASDFLSRQDRPAILSGLSCETLAIRRRPTQLARPSPHYSQAIQRKPDAIKVTRLDSRRRIR